MPTVVIVGAGQAGCQVAASLREEGFTGRVVVIGDEVHLPYQRPPLSKGHLTGKSERESLWLRPVTWFEQQQVEVRTGATVTTIDRGAKTIGLSDGSAVSYDHLVLATGARNRSLPVDGADLDGVFQLRSLDDADALRSQLGYAQNVVVIGGGFIGLEVAATAAALGKSTTVIEVADRLMARVLSSPGADFLLDAHRRRGVQFELGQGVERIVGVGGAVAAVDTADRRRVQADLVLVGIGATPNAELATSAGLLVDNGIVVDEMLRTSDPHIYAVGDCAAHRNAFAGGTRVRLESVQNAVAQARAVAATIAGSPQRFHSVPWFWSDQADLKIQIAGLTTGHDKVVIKGQRADEKFSIYCFRGRRLIGVESINRPADHMAARRLLALPKTPSYQQVLAGDFDAKVFTAKLVP